MAMSRCRRLQIGRDGGSLTEGPHDLSSAGPAKLLVCHAGSDHHQHQHHGDELRQSALDAVESTVAGLPGVTQLK
ncbi:hypothetical protein PF002_g11494 [Phytophthora fragariae]|uniref:Uncharacterized protein n=1 Tax=Phytophthora fragariae TaxID=53985 RepID=A0A6A3ZIR2_9STRA|nr:hypothetical protein PF009_g11411 [Phytophthora fragariae]KAE9012215.1 hypothetical protein PF011_g9011 [Phytophthora fragariae]KAE9114605.1 hypothetical protein PF007_g10305 [Phytophthora fragariae]KAE9145677.1 hypothetical protein PF006_g9492 [Phytophthora fragariae]KAE9235559.1 hypothetical protein PF002_g11494 [Phytophthora fragariae]